MDDSRYDTAERFLEENYNADNYLFGNIIRYAMEQENKKEVLEKLLDGVSEKDINYIVSVRINT